MSNISPAESPLFTFFDTKTGLIETIDKHTGRIVAIQKSKLDLLSQKESKMIAVLDDEGQTVWVEKGISLSNFKIVHHPEWVYSDVIAEIICQKIVAGSTIIDVCSETGVPPYSVVARWRREIPAFAEKLKQVHCDRGDYYHGQAIKEAEAATEETVQVKKLLTDTYKWAAGVDNSERFGNKTKVTGDPSAPVVFVIETGIRREGDPGFAKEVEATAVPQTLIKEKVSEADSG